MEYSVLQTSFPGFLPVFAACKILQYPCIPSLPDEVSRSCLPDTLLPETYHNDSLSESSPRIHYCLESFRQIEGNGLPPPEWMHSIGN